MPSSRRTRAAASVARIALTSAWSPCRIQIERALEKSDIRLEADIREHGSHTQIGGGPIARIVRAEAADRVLTENFVHHSAETNLDFSVRGHAVAVTGLPRQLGAT